MKRCAAVLFALALIFAPLSPGATAVGGGVGVVAGNTIEVSGHWEKTDTLYFGPSRETAQDGDLTVAAAWSDARDMVYTFTSSNGERSVFTVTPYWLEDSYYTFSSVQPGVNIVREADSEDAPGDVTAALVFADIQPGAGKYGVKVDTRSKFKTYQGQEIDTFSIHENMSLSSGSDGKKFYLTPTGNFPEGETGGEKLYVVLGVMDGGSGETRMYTAWEYTWVDQPETIQVPDQYGPIEYSPMETILKLAAVILIPVLILVLVVVLLLRRRKRRSQ